MNNWMQQLRDDCQKEYDHKPWVATFATIRKEGPKNFPDARSVVVRSVSESGDLLITSDARSDKNQQLRINPSATVVFWLASTRKQFIIDGAVQILTSEGSDLKRAQAWKDSSDSARSLFLWPKPGEAFHNDSEFPKAAPATSAIPTVFEVLILNPISVESLDVKVHPHLRVRWSMASTGWSPSTINP